MKKKTPAKPTKTKPRKPDVPHHFAKKQNGKNDVGRKKIELELKQVEAACRTNPTDEELAAILNVSTATLENRKGTDPEFMAAMDRGRALGRTSLRGKQWEVAMGRAGDPEKGIPERHPDVKMLIHLGKNELGQSDKNLIGNDPKNPFLTTFTMDITRPENADG